MKSGKYKWIIGILAAAAILLGVFAWYAVWGIRDKGYENEGVMVYIQNVRGYEYDPYGLCKVG